MERDYVKYPNLGRPPKTLHECFRVDPLWCATYPEYARLHEYFRTDPRGASSFGQWIEDRIWELLQRPCRAHELIGKSYSARYEFSSAANAVKWCAWRRAPLHGGYQVVLLDGTVIKEWPADAANHR